MAVIDVGTSLNFHFHHHDAFSRRSSLIKYILETERNCFHAGGSHSLDAKTMPRLRINIYEGGSERKKLFDTFDYELNLNRGPVCLWRLFNINDSHDSGIRSAARRQVKINTVIVIRAALSRYSMKYERYFEEKQHRVLTYNK